MQRISPDRMVIGKPQPGMPGRSLWRFLPAVIVVGGLCLGYAMGWQHYLSLAFLSDSHELLQDFVASHPFSAPIGFALLYALSVAFSFPAASALTVVAGFLFGWLVGGAIVVAAATVGATAVFLAASTACGEALRARIGRRAGRLAAGFEENAFLYLLVLRLAPVFPFFIVNVAPALFRVPLKTYMAATVIGILPATFVYAYLGTGLESVLDAASAAGRTATIGELATPQITLAFVLLAVVAAASLVLRKVRARGRG